ncbi:MAG TPA: response regulator transcription factor, partial [Marmoricola sp.]|nr:response regulator transcription factor [Marmoricola sp.]
GSRVMVVEDDPTIGSVVEEYLRAGEYQVERFSDGAEAWRAAQRQMPDLVIVDRMLPGLDGDELCRRIREISGVPIIMVTALDGLEHRIRGLERGADDYIAKPFSLRELHLRVAAQLRRSASTTAPLDFEVGPFRIDPAHRRVWMGEKEIALTAREYELMLYLAQNADRVVSRDEILREVWEWAFGDSSTVTVHVRRLREKIEPDPQIPTYLCTEWGQGYRLRVTPPEASR